VIIHAHVSKLNLENPIGIHSLYPATVECPDCKGTGMVDCARRAAGVALGVVGSGLQSADNRSGQMKRAGPTR